MSTSILDRLAEGPVLGDGGYVFILKERGVPMDDYSPYGILSSEETVRGLYQEFFDAGADVIQRRPFRVHEIGSKGLVRPTSMKKFTEVQSRLHEVSWVTKLCLRVQSVRLWGRKGWRRRD